MHVSVYVHVCTLVDIPLCVCTRECAFVFAYDCVYICGVCASGGQRLTFGVGDSLSFYLLRQGLIMNPELASSTRLASQLTLSNQSLPTGTGITALALG